MTRNDGKQPPRNGIGMDGKFTHPPSPTPPKGSGINPAKPQGGKPSAPMSPRPPKP